MEELHLSARAYDHILKVAHTIADLAGSEDIRIFGLLMSLKQSNIGRWTGICGIELFNFQVPTPSPLADTFFHLP